MSLVPLNRAAAPRGMPRNLGVALLAVLAASACGPAANGAAGAAELAGSAWRLVTLTPDQGAAPRPPASAPESYTAAFGTDGTVGGRAHCNSYSGRYVAGESGALAIGEIGATLMACSSPSLSDDFLLALQSATRYALDGDALAITFGAGGTLTFERSAETAAAP